MPKKQQKSTKYTAKEGLPSADTHDLVTEENYRQLGMDAAAIGHWVRKPKDMGQGGPMHDETMAGRGGMQNMVFSTEMLKSFARANQLLKGGLKGDRRPGETLEEALIREYEELSNRNPSEPTQEERIALLETNEGNVVEMPESQVPGKRKFKPWTPDSPYSAYDEGSSRDPNVEKFLKLLKEHEEEAQKDTAKFARREGIPKDTKPFEGQSLAGMSDLLDQAIAESRNKEKADYLDRVKERAKKNRIEKLMKAEKDPLKTGESFTTLHNYEARKREHDHLLREYGFPSEIDPAAGRYQRYAEVETDGKGVVMHNKPPWIVAENSEMIAEINDEDAPSYSKSPKATNREGKETMSLTKRLLKLYKQAPDTGMGSYASSPSFKDSSPKPPTKQPWEVVRDSKRAGNLKDMGRSASTTPDATTWMTQQGGDPKAEGNIWDRKSVRGRTKDMLQGGEGSTPYDYEMGNSYRGPDPNARPNEWMRNRFVGGRREEHRSDPMDASNFGGDLERGRPKNPGSQKLLKQYVMAAQMMKDWNPFKGKKGDDSPEEGSTQFLDSHANRTSGGMMATQGLKDQYPDDAFLQGIPTAPTGKREGPVGRQTRDWSDTIYADVGDAVKEDWDDKGGWDDQIWGDSHPSHRREVERRAEEAKKPHSEQTDERGRLLSEIHGEGSYYDEGRIGNINRDREVEEREAEEAYRKHPDRAKEAKAKQTKDDYDKWMGERGGRSIVSGPEKKMEKLYKTLDGMYDTMVSLAKSIDRRRNYK